MTPVLSCTTTIHNVAADNDSDNDCVNCEMMKMRTL